MIDLNDRDKIREALEERGYPPEYIDAALAICDSMPAIITWACDSMPAIITRACDVWADIVQAVQEVEAALARSEEFQAMMESLQELEILTEALPDSPAPVPPQKRQKLRPPRYIGPTSKTAQRARRPPRVARSSCRKIRR